MDDTKKEIEELKNEITGLKIRVHRLEDFIKSFPTVDDYLSHDHDSEPEEEPLFKEAKEIVGNYDRASVSLLQRKLSIGYALADRLMAMLEEAGVVGPGDGSKPRDVLIKNEPT